MGSELLSGVGLQQGIFQNEQGGQNPHRDGNVLRLACKCINQHVRDESNQNAVRNAVGSFAFLLNTRTSTRLRFGIDILTLYFLAGLSVRPFSF